MATNIMTNLTSQNTKKLQYMLQLVCKIFSKSLQF